MEVFILDPQLRRTEVIDLFESCIWTERFKEEGDFELVVHNTPSIKRQLTPNTVLAMNLSKRMMIIDTTTTNKDASGKDMLTVSGKSYETILRDRPAVKLMTYFNDKREWVISGTPQYVGRTVFREIVENGENSYGDRLPFLVPNTTGYPPSSIPEPTQAYDYTLDPTSVYETLENLFKEHDLGFRIIRMGDDSKIYFDIYTGHDRTSRQSDREAVVFSTKLDNLQNVNELSSSSDHKNAALVLSKLGQQYVYPKDVPAGLEGINRKVLVVKALDVEDELGPGLAAKLDQIGRDALAEHQLLQAFDGEVSQHATYQYDRHYMLGDLVEMRDDGGGTNIMRVTEQIFAADGEGERSYPTLSLNQYIAPGGWGNWDYGQYWQDLTTETWDTI